MSRKKKSRKVGQIGTPKTSTNKRVEKEKRIRKPKGKPAGTRNSEAKIASESGSKTGSKDPRHGSKKPVNLFIKEPVEKKSQTPRKVKYFSPAKELEAIEQDSKLASLLDRLDSNKKLGKEEQHYVDERLLRHKELCIMLGIEDESGEANELPIENDPFDSFESINIDDYKD